VKECPLCRACANDDVELCPNDSTRLESTIPGPTLLDGKYDLERRLGQGGMGVVYRARHLDLHRPVAIKIIASTREGFSDRFRIEAAALGRLEHPHIVDVMDFGVDDARGMAYLVMELLEGVTLAARCDASGPPERREAVDILQKVAAAVDFAHDHGILHRDLKPANVFLVRTNTGTAIKILDFGLAQFLSTSQPDAPAPSTAPQIPRTTASDETTILIDAREPAPAKDGRRDLLDLQRRDQGLLMGTVGYMAPELFRFEPATRASDIYAFGVLAYQLMTGSLPPVMRGGPHNITRPSDASPNVPRELDQPLMQLLGYAPGDRPRSARAAIDAIAAAERAATVREWRERERPRRTAAAAALGLITTLSAALWTSAPVARLERAAVDARFGLARPSPPNPSILLLAMDDASVDADAKPLGLRADEIGATLNRVFDAGARVVGVDLLLPRAWADFARRSPEPPPFAQLLIRHADRLTLAAFTTDTGTVLGPECVPGLVSQVLGAERTQRLFGFVNLDTDADGIARHARLHYSDTNGQLRPTWAARVALTSGTELQTDRDSGTVDYTVDPARFRRMSWRDVERVVTTSPEIFRDRIVLLGGEFAGSGDEHHPTPLRQTPDASVSGLMVQAIIVNTILDGFPVRESARWPFAVVTGIGAGILAWLVLMRRSRSRPVTLTTASITAHVAAALSVFLIARVLWPVAGPVISLLIAVGAAFVWRAKWGAPPAGE
jgi:serine/threonine protein kinase/CHASE2 domain-containing sensor protein